MRTANPAASLPAGKPSQVASVGIEEESFRSEEEVAVVLDQITGGAGPVEAAAILVVIQEIERERLDQQQSARPAAVPSAWIRAIWPQRRQALIGSVGPEPAPPPTLQR